MSPHIPAAEDVDDSQVNTYWNWGDVANADRYLEQLEGLRDTNATSET